MVEGRPPCAGYPSKLQHSLFLFSVRLDHLLDDTGEGAHTLCFHVLVIMSMIK